MPASLFWYDAATLATVRDRLAAGDPALRPALERLQAEVETALAQAPLTVTAKTALAPSGKANDYCSLAPYWWPDPQRPDGRPYLRRDGVVNPESRDPTRSDKPTLEVLAATVETLGWGRLLLDDRRCAQHAALLLRTFFIDARTRMTPHLRHAQVNQGHDDGRAIGIIDGRRLVFLLDAVRILAGDPAWSAEDDRALRAWFADYLAWLTTHDFGRQAAAMRNNHGTWYDVQVAAYADLLGQDALRRQALERARERIAQHFDARGGQPHELARTRSFDYSAMNLQGFLLLARLGERAGVDLWGHQAGEGRSLRAGLGFLLPYADPDRPWPHEQVKDLDRTQLIPLLRIGSRAYGHEPYEAALERFGAVLQAHRIQLLLPTAP